LRPLFKNIEELYHRRVREGIFNFGFWIADPFTFVQDKLWIGVWIKISVNLRNQCLNIFFWPIGQLLKFTFYPQFQIEM